MVNYLGKFIPNLAEVTAPLRAILKKDVAFNLQKSQLDAIGKLKTLITSAPILKIFDPDLPTRLKIDASSEGLGALLEQNRGSLENPQWHPIGYSSRTLRVMRNDMPKLKKRLSLYSFWSRTLPRIFVWSYIYHH